MEKNKLMMIIIIALLVILIAVIGLASFFFMKSMTANPAAEEAPKKEVTQEVVALSQKDIDVLPIGDPISTNLLKDVDNASHMARFSFAIGVNNTLKKDKESEEFLALIATKHPVLRDIAIGVVASKTLTQLERPDGKEVLKSDILDKLQDEFGNNMIVEVYISDIMTQ